MMVNMYALGTLKRCTLYGYAGLASCIGRLEKFPEES